MFIFVGAVLIIYAIVLIVLGIKLLSLRNWAKVTEIIISIIAGTFILVNVVFTIKLQQGASAILIPILIVIVDFAIAFYLSYNKDVKKAFILG